MRKCTTKQKNSPIINLMKFDKRNRKRIARQQRFCKIMGHYNKMLILLILQVSKRNITSILSKCHRTKRHYISESSSSFDHYFSPPKKAKQSPLVWSESEESLVSESNYDMLKDLKDAIGLEGDVEEEEILIAAEPFMIFLDINHEEHDDIIQLLHQNEQPE